MSQPKKRKHPHHTDTPKLPRGIIYHKVIPVAITIFILFGVGIAFFAAGTNIPWLIAGAIIGAGVGLFFGYHIAKALTKEK